MLRTLGLRQQRQQLFRSLSSMSASNSQTPMEDAIREKITKELSPTTLKIKNDSQAHAHHAPMQGSTSKETHFNVTVISSAFASKSQPSRHRIIYNLLKDEIAQEGGIHALQLKTRTPEEEEKIAQRQK